MKNRFIRLVILLGFAAFASVSHADNSISTAIRISPSGVAPGLAINPAGDVDFYRLDFSSPGRFTVFSEGRTDTFGCLVNSSGGFLTSNDDVSSSNLNFSITREVSSGTFYVFVRHYSRTGTGAYSLRTQFVPSQPVDPEGNTIATALGLTMSNNAVSHNGAINTACDVDMFAVTIPAAGFLNAFSGGTTDVVGRILNASGTQLAENDDISSTNLNFAMRTQINAGTYFVEVRHFGRTSTGTYGLNVGFEPASYTGNTSLRALVVGISDFPVPRTPAKQSPSNGQAVAPQSAFAIYGIPFNASSVLRIDPIAWEATLVGDVSSIGAMKWRGGAVGKDGSIYGAPCDAPLPLKISTPKGALGR
jgi:hypothetical protein